MCNIVINDLRKSKILDRVSMETIRGGRIKLDDDVEEKKGAASQGAHDLPHSIGGYGWGYSFKL